MENVTESDKYVKTAELNKIVEGYPDGLFRPADQINFAEALKVILETMDADIKSVSYQSNPLVHVKRGKWFEPYFSYAQQKNLINSEKFYHPAQYISRGEFVEIMYRLKYIQTYNLESFIESRKNRIR